MTSFIAVKHSFETAHRLPILEGKCQNLHGHSWQVEIEFEGEMDEHGVLVEYGTLKKLIRTYIDEFIDHGTILGSEDPLVDALLADPYHKKLMIFGEPKESRRIWSIGATKKISIFSHMPWPTVEAVAQMLQYNLRRVVQNAGLADVHPSQVKLSETGVNVGGWRK